MLVVRFFRISTNPGAWCQTSGDESEVVGYVLGRMEDKTFPSFRDPRNPAPPTGHVTSLAVLPAFRRCGVAHQLMVNLHEQVSHRSCSEPRAEDRLVPNLTSWRMHNARESRLHCDCMRGISNSQAIWLLGYMATRLCGRFSFPWSPAEGRRLKPAFPLPHPIAP